MPTPDVTGLAEVVGNLHMVSLAHEAILRSLITKVAREHTSDEAEKLEWIKEIQDSVLSLNAAISDHARATEGHKQLSKDIDEEVKKFFKPFR